MRGELARARELAEAAIPTAVEAGSIWDEGAAHTVLGIVANAEGDRERARHHHQRSIELAEQLGIEPVVQKLNLGVVALDSGDYEEAIALLEDVLASHRRDGNAHGCGFALLNLGLAHYELGDREASRREFEEARACLGESGVREQLAHALQGLAAAEARDRRFEEAARLLAQARRELDELGTSENGFAPAMVAETKAAARAALGDEAFEEAYGAGRDAGDDTGGS
jgi:tetratricopeptide (TPR) repeat protein